MGLIKKLFKTILILILVLCLICGASTLYAFKYAPHHFSQTYIPLQASQLSGSLTIAVIADTHFSNDYTTEDFKKVITVINNQKPDLIFFLGDLFDNFNEHSNPSEISDSLSQLHGKLGKYAIFGNHDYGGGAENYYEDIMKDGDFKVLKNESVKLPTYNATITGIDDYVLGYGDISCTNYLPASSYNIALCHEPDIIDKITDQSVNLMISGHTHGGQVEIPFYGNLYLPKYGTKYIKGQYEIDNKSKSILYVNRGLGTTRVAARFLASPEVTFLQINK